MITASAPNKIHIAGEHSVVYGGRALMAPVEVDGRRNVVTLTEKPGAPRLTFIGDIGTAFIDEAGEFGGDAVYYPTLETAKFIMVKCGKKIEKNLQAKLEFSDSPKGTGNSASIPAAFAVALYDYFGYKPTRKELYDTAFVCDNLLHDGKSSGGDVNAVLADRPQEFRRVYESGGIRVEYNDVALTLPKGVVIILVDSYKGGEKAITGNMVELFAKAHGVLKKPAEMTDAERKKVYAPFDDVLARMEKEMREKGSVESLGKLFDENHALLQSVSCEEIEEVRKVAKQNGAFGSKLIGAGGKGGAVIALCGTGSTEKIKAALKKVGFASYAVVFAKKGACLD